MAGGTNHVTAASEQFVTQFDHPQVWPNLRPEAEQLGNEVRPGKFRPGLCKHQDRSGSGARVAGMAMYQEVSIGLRCIRQLAHELQQGRDMQLIGKLHAGPPVDDVMEAQLQPFVA